jgi:cadmium resistance protein CadD (predicted permease)
MELIFLAGIYGFHVTSIDDFLVLCFLFTVYKKNMWAIMTGTALGLGIVVLASLVVPNLLSSNKIDISQFSSFFISIAMFYIASGVLKNKDDEKDDEFENLKKTTAIFFKACIVYVQNGLDDLITYTSFLVSYSISEQITFIAGIFFGLLILYVLAFWFNQKVEKIQKIKQDKIKFIFARFAVFVGIIYLFHGYYIIFYEYLHVNI